MNINGLPSPATRLGAVALGLALTIVACGSSDADGESAPNEAQTEEAAQTPTNVDEAAPAADDAAADDGFKADDCDYSTFVYTPFTEIPADWPTTFPAPELLEEITGEVGVGCDRVTVDMRGRFYGDTRSWVVAYGEQLSAAGFELDTETDELNQLIRTYRLGQDNINYGGTIELGGSDREYMTVGIVLTDFPG